MRLICCCEQINTLTAMPEKKLKRDFTKMIAVSTEIDSLLSSLLIEVDYLSSFIRHFSFFCAGTECVNHHRTYTLCSGADVRPK